MGKFFAWVKGLFTNGKRVKELEAEVSRLLVTILDKNQEAYCIREELNTAKKDNVYLRSARDRANNNLYACRLTLTAIATSKVKDEPGFRNTSSLAIRHKEWAQKVIDELWPAEGAAK